MAIPQIHHRTLLANKGSKVQDICHELGVQIKFPDRNREGDNKGAISPGQEGPAVPNGHAENGSAESVEVEGENPRDFVTVSGRADKCQLAKEKLEVRIFELSLLLINSPIWLLSGLNSHNGSHQCAL